MENGKRTMLVPAVFACLCATAAGLPRDYSQGLLDREQVLAAAAQVTRRAYPNADRVHVDDFTMCEYQPDGTAVTWSDNYTKVLTENGRRQKQTMSFNFLLPYSQVTVLLLEVIKPDGVVVPVDLRKQSKVVARPSQLSSRSYNPNSKVLEIGVPDLQVDDVVHLLTRHDTLRRVMPNTWDDFQVFESVAPIQHAVYEVHAPKQRPLCRMALKDPVEGTVTYSTYECGDRIISRWEVAHVPGFCPEPGMPPSYTVVQRLLVSTLPDWNAISSWYWALCKPHLEATTPEMQATVDKLTEGVTDRRKKVEAIFHWVSQQIQYMGVTTDNESPGWEPDDVEVTFANRHGVCRDKAAVLVAMLRLAGLEAYPVLMGLGPARDTEVPLTNFHHAIACVRNDDGSYVLMDCTNENTRGLLPSYLYNQSYLVARPEGETLRTSPVVPAEENMVFVETAGSIDAKRTLSAETVLRLEGISDHVHRGHLSRSSPEERQRHFESLLKASIASATLTGFELRPMNMQDTSEPLSIHMRYIVEDFLVGKDATIVMPLPRLGTKFVLLNTGIGRTSLQERHFPLRISSTFGVHEILRLKMDLATVSVLSVPEFEPIENETTAWKRTLKYETNTLQEESEFLVKAVEFSPSQYRQLKESLRQIEHNERRLLLLTRPLRAGPPKADIVVLNDSLEYDLTDAQNWRERRRITKEVLTYKGQKDAAELRLDYNPAWQEVNLIRATVTKGDQIREIGEKAIHLMDAPWVASAPRYPASEILVVNIPGVEVGSVVTYEYEQVSRNHPFFAATHHFRDFDPIREQTVTLTAPATLALQIAIDNNGIAVPDAAQAPQAEPAIVESVACRESKIIRQWRTRNQASVPQESSTPPLDSFNPVLRVTTGNWGTYAAEVLAVLVQAARGQAGAAQCARELVRQAQNRQDRIIAIRDFVARNIRSAGPVFGELPLTAVSNADQTLADGYGHTADRAVLLYCMLEAAGLNPEFTLVSSGPRIEQFQHFDVRYPTVKTFDNVLVSVRCGSAHVYLNDTSQYAALGTTPAEGRLALPLTRGKMEIISVTEDNRDARSCIFRLALTEQGDVRLAVTQSSYGDSFAERHKFFAEMSPEERDRYQRGLMAEISQAAVAVDSLATDFDSYPGTESFSLQVERYAVRDGEFLYFEVPLLITSLFDLPSGKRENPFYHPRHWHSDISATIELPRGFSNVLLMPSPKEWFLPGGGRVRVNVTRQNCRADQPACLSLTQEVDLHPFIQDARACADLQEIERQLNLVQSRMILLTRSE